MLGVIRYGLHALILDNRVHKMQVCHLKLVGTQRTKCTLMVFMGVVGMVGCLAELAMQ